MPTSKITVYRYQKPALGIKVSLEFTGITNMGFTKSFYTNSDGVSFIEHSSSGIANVYIDGKMKGKLKTPGQDIYYL